MVPFLSASVEEILRVLVKAILKQDVLKEATTALSLIKIDVARPARSGSSQAWNSLKAIFFLNGM